MIGPTPQTILSVLTGGAREGSRALAHGVALPPFSVGSQGAWAIFAPGVEPVHLFIGFDGTQVHVAKAAPGYQLLLAGVELGQGWHIVPVPCELRFGGACIAVSADEKRLITQPFGRVGAHGDEPLAPPGQVRTQFIARPSPVQSSPPAQPVPGPVAQEPGQGFVPVQATPHVQGGQVWQTTQPIGSQAPQTPYGLGGTVQVRPSPGAPAPQVLPQPALAVPQTPPRLEPSPAVVLGQGQQPFDHPVNPQAPTQLSAPSGGQGVPGALAAAPTMNSASPSSFQPASGPRTLGDGGALREHAARVAQATPSVAFASAQAYVADVQRASGTTPPPAGNVQPGVAGFVAPPTVASPTVEGPSAFPKPDGFSGPPAQWAPHETVPKPKTSGLRASWREASLVKKLTVALLPFGLLGVALMPDEQPAAPAQVNAPSASGAGSASLVSKSAASAAAIPPSGDSVPVATASAGPGPELVASAMPPASAAPLASGPIAAASASGAPVAAASASGAPVAAASASGAPIIAVLPSSSGAPASAARGPTERDAINAAFEGRSAMAAKLYERLASGGGERVFALAARLAREDVVRKPAISH